MDTPSTESLIESTPAQANTDAAAVGQTSAETQVQPGAGEEGKPAGEAAIAEAKPTEGEAKPEGEKKPEAATGAPEKYEAFTVPEGYEINEQLLNDFTPLLKDLNLPQAAAQKVIDFAPKLIEATQNQTVAALLGQMGLAEHASWPAAVKADKEIGGDKYAENLAVVKKAAQTFATPELHAVFKQTGLGNHPEVVRLFLRLGKSISEDGFVRGGESGKEPAPAQKLFSASKMNP